MLYNHMKCKVVSRWVKIWVADFLKAGISQLLKLCVQLQWLVVFLKDLFSKQIVNTALRLSYTCINIYF